ncbi:uncharacterized protein LOC122403431 [Colletes gigas]|uniref:uncharacterized protein LOC122403431 n=1 Tax=Colletes gigas TaxID=935657 RepID=UPI001C9AE9C9|nr:uncharacterized protein LOC122403431 [Colletes gigas]
MSFHEFNSLTGRLKQSTQLQSLNPLPPRPLQSSEIPVMIYDSIKTKPLKVATPTENYSTLPPRMAALYKKYQADMTKPVYRMGGKKDRILYGISIIGVTIGFVMNIYYLNKGAKK